MTALRNLGSGWLGFIPSSSSSFGTHPHIIGSARPRRLKPQQQLRVSRPAWLSTDVNEAEHQVAVDELWWKEGDGVQSLEIRCRCVWRSSAWDSPEVQRTGMACYCSLPLGVLDADADADADAPLIPDIELSWLAKSRRL